MSRMEYRSPPGTAVGLVDDVDDHAVKFVFPMGVVDRHSTVFAPLAFSDSLRRDPNPPFLFAHRMDDPVGVAIHHQIIPNGPRPRLEIINKFDPFDASPSAKRAHAAIASGSCSSASFGFSDGEHVAHRSLKSVRVYTRCRLRETSCVPAGSIPGARATHLRSAFGAGYGDWLDADELHALDLLDRLEHRAGLQRLRRGERYDRQDNDDELAMARLVAMARLDGRLLTQGARR